MAGKESDNADVDRTPIGGGFVDVEFEPGGPAYLGLFEQSGKPYARADFNGSLYVEDLVGALKRLKKKVQKGTGSAKIEGVCLGGENAHVEFTEKGEAYIGLTDSGKENVYVRIKFDGVPPIERVIKALQKVKAKVKKTEE